MKYRIRRIFVSGMISALLLVGTAFAQSPTSVEGTSPGAYKLTSSQRTALQAYVQGRYRRVKTTVDNDRAQARSNLSKDAWSQYVDQFHPETAIPQFKQCAECAEFGIRITRMDEANCTIFRSQVDESSELTCSTMVEFQTQPIKPVNAPVRRMASILRWTPRRAGPISASTDAVYAMREAGPSIEITDDRQLVQRSPVGACLQQAASGQLCQ